MDVDRPIALVLDLEITGFRSAVHDDHIARDHLANGHHRTEVDGRLERKQRLRRVPEITRRRIFEICLKPLTKYLNRIK